MNSTDQTYARMTLQERAQALAGDMPWITRDLSPEAYKDFVAQLASAFRAVEWQARLEAIDEAPEPRKPNWATCEECGATMSHYRTRGYECSVNPRHIGIKWPTGDEKR